ncbi:MAG: hypothetical protein JWQ71_4089 [Pedosphaera sp.]|nr:hypothetical protein [Pedosphaera sp.]
MKSILCLTGVLALLATTGCQSDGNSSGAVGRAEYFHNYGSGSSAGNREVEYYPYYHAAPVVRDNNRAWDRDNRPW